MLFRSFRKRHLVLHAILQTAYHGRIIKVFRSGYWARYIREILFPLAQKAEELATSKQDNSFIAGLAPIDDTATFANILSNATKYVPKVKIGNIFDPAITDNSPSWT